MKFSFLIIFFLINFSVLNADTKKKIAYIVSDTSIPFWNIMAKGVKNSANTFDYEIEIYNSSNNKDGAYEIGKFLAKKISSLNIENPKVAIIAIPQKRLNGQERTAGFIKAMDESAIKGANIKQQVDFSTLEAYNYTKELMAENPDLNAIWIQSSNMYQGALDAIYESGKKDKILVLTFDAEPEFLELISNNTLIASAMQQPFLMGEKAVVTLHKHFNNEKVEKNYKLPVLVISKDNIKENLHLIKRNVLGLDNTIINNSN